MCTLCVGVGIQACNGFCNGTVLSVIYLLSDNIYALFAFNLRIVAMIREMYMYMYLWDAFTCIIVTSVSLSSSLSPSFSPSLLLSFSLPPSLLLPPSSLPLPLSFSLPLSPSPSPSLPPLPSLPLSLPLLLPQVQKVLALTQSPSVLEAIGDLIRARPGDPVLAFSNSSLSTSSPLHIAPERRKLTLRKKLPTPNRIGCNCGKCARCIPSPSGESLCTYMCIYVYCAC